MKTNNQQIVHLEKAPAGDVESPIAGRRESLRPELRRKILHALMNRIGQEVRFRVVFDKLPGFAPT